MYCLLNNKKLVGLALAEKWENMQIEFLLIKVEVLKVSGMLLVRVGNIKLEGIRIIWDRKLYTKTYIDLYRLLYSSKTSMNFVDFSFMIFWAQNVLISSPFSKV